MLFPWLARALGERTPSEEDRRLDAESFEHLARLIEKHQGPEFRALVERLAKKSASLT